MVVPLKLRAWSRNLPSTEFRPPTRETNAWPAYCYAILQACRVVNDQLSRLPVWSPQMHRIVRPVTSVFFRFLPNFAKCRVTAFCRTCKLNEFRFDLSLFHSYLP